MRIAFSPGTAATPQCAWQRTRTDRPALRKDMKGERIPDSEDQMAGLYQFQIRPGEVTLCRLQEYHDRWKMLIVKGQIIPQKKS